MPWPDSPPGPSTPAPLTVRAPVLPGGPTAWNRWCRAIVTYGGGRLSHPDHDRRHCGDIFMACSDFPHSEGTATPLADYERAGCPLDPAAPMCGGNVRDLIGG